MEAPTVGIGRLLKEGGRFFVPHHQRDYSWSEDELDQFFQDIEDARKSGQAVHPILLSALENFADNEIERLLRLLEVIIVRYQLIGGGRTGRLEISCAKLAHRIFEGSCQTATQAAETMKDVFPGDAEFREAFKTKQEKNSQKARYVLSRLEKQARLSGSGSVSGRELEPSASLTLEHIFPKSPGYEWAKLSEQDPSFGDDCTYRLGNLCLLTGVNRSLGNLTFEEKKKTYFQSDLLLTRELGEMAEWNREAVERWQDSMAKLAGSYWRFN